MNSKLKIALLFVINIFLLINFIILASALPDYFDWRNKDGKNCYNNDDAQCDSFRCDSTCQSKLADGQG